MFSLLLAVDWEAKDALNYYGTALAFLGTAVFSALALWQNHIFKKANDDHEKMLEDMEKARNMPVLCLSVDSKSGSNVWVKLENKSENIASEIDIEEAIIIDNEGAFRSLIIIILSLIINGLNLFLIY